METFPPTSSLRFFLHVKEIIASLSNVLANFSFIFEIDQSFFHDLEDV